MVVRFAAFPGKAHAALNFMVVIFRAAAVLAAGGSILAAATAARGFPLAAARAAGFVAMAAAAAVPFVLAAAAVVIHVGIENAEIFHNPPRRLLAPTQMSAYFIVCETKGKVKKKERPSIILASHEPNPRPPGAHSAPHPQKRLQSGVQIQSP